MIVVHPLSQLDPTLANLATPTLRRPKAAPVAEPPPAEPHGPDMAQSYNAYFRTGLYEARYPAPNRRTLRHALAHLPKGGRFLDFGSGTGRYCLPLLGRSDVSGVAADISAVALQTLTDRATAAGVTARLSVIDSTPDAVSAAAAERPFDLCLLAFGVLGHVIGRAHRLALQETLRCALRPGGVLLIGLPNAARRLRAEQRAMKANPDPKLEPGDVLYARHASDEDIALYYHLYTQAEIMRDLHDSGFAVRSLSAESLLPENIICHNPILGRLDDWACRIVPPGLAYGFLVTATPRAS